MAAGKDSSLLEFLDTSPLSQQFVPRKITSVNNPDSVHGIYPYRGKISALDAAMILSQLRGSRKLLDPFCGSGTIIYEGYRRGMSVVGIDNNPIAIALSKGKMSLADADKFEIIRIAESIVHYAKNLDNVKLMPSECTKAFHPITGDEIMRVASFYDKMPDYLRAIFLGSICLAARGCNHYMWTSTTVGKDISPKQYIPFYSKFLQKVKKHFHPLPKGESYAVFHYDSRSLDEIIEPNTIDYVFTSPPYFDGLDYTAYYAKFIYPIIGHDRNNIRKKLIQNTKTYEDDMKQVLSKLLKVTKEDALIIFVVGDKKMNDGRIINGGKFFSGLLHHEPSQIFERTYTTTPSKQIFDVLNKTSRQEQIVIWDKSKW